MRSLSLFSGYGGLDMAVEAVTGAKPAAFVEFDPAPSSILAHHWPDVPNLGDVTKIDWSVLTDIDIITGGSPCQDLSAAGKRAGMTEGTRSNLWVNMREAINTIRPRLVVWENVRGALSATARSDSDMEPGAGLLGGGAGGHLRAMGRVLGDLADLGYDAEWATIRASDIGAPHHRARVFLIAYPQGGSIPASRWSLDNDRGNVEGGSVHLLPTPTVGDRGGEDSRGGEGFGKPLGEAVLDVLPTPNASDSSGGGQHPDKRVGHSRQLIDYVLDMNYLPTPKAHDGIMGRPRTTGRPIDKSTHLGTIVTLLPTPQAHDAVGGKSREQIEAMRAKGHGVSNLNETAEHELNELAFGKYESAVRQWEQAIGAPAPAPTELNRNGKPRLNPAFAEWMMGLAPGHVTAVPGLSRANQLKAIGNGVCPQQAAAALAQLLGDKQEATE